LILSDFTGRTNRGIGDAGDLAQRKIRTVDVDNLDTTLAAMKPELRLPVDEKSVIPLVFNSLDDLRPDALLQKIPALQAMLMLRGQLQNSKTFAQAAAVVRQLMGKVQAQPAAATPGAEAGESEFEKMLNRPVAHEDAAQVTTDALIANLVAGYTVPAADPEQKELVALVEDAVSAGLRAVLRHPAFQSLERAWRGVAFLTSRLNTDAEVAVNILDVSKEELQADLVGEGRELEATAMYAHLVEKLRAPGSVPVSLVIGDYLFDQSEESVALLARLGTLMQAAEISFVAGAPAQVAGVAAFAELAAINSAQWRAPANLGAWEQLRKSPEAEHLGLTAPRFLLRLPYGPKTDAVEAFAFEEMPGAPVPEQYLWANGAFAVALLIGEAILENGFEGAADAGNDVSDLPCHMAMVEGDREMTPCAEAYLPDRVADILRGLGLIPILSVKNAAAVKVGGMNSMARGKELAGLQ
jgi:type VI secretion system protein ImpC